MLKIQLFSDLHLEFSDNPPPKIDSDTDILILAGDIGFPHETRYQTLLKTCNKTVKHTILISGNHEYYYPQGFQKVDIKIQELVDELPNVYFLQNSYVDIGDLRFLGCTLWTHIPDQHQLLETMMNDYQKIKTKIKCGASYKKRKLSTAQVNIWHQISQEWLEKSIEEACAQNKTIVVVTHHTPLLSKYDKDLTLNYGYHSDQSKLLESEKVLLWCHGHTHNAHQTLFNKTLVWCNPSGYPGEYTGHNPQAEIYLDQQENGKYELFM